MTQSQETPKMTLADAMAKVHVTPGQAIALLNNLGEGHSDRDPDLVASINKAITEISGGTSTAAKEEEHTEPASTSTVTSRSR